MESPWGFHEQKFGILNSNRIPNSELLPLKSPWQFHEQKFGIRNSIALFDLFAQKSQNGMWNSEFRTSAHGIAMAIPRAEVRNSEFYWNSEFRTSALGIPMAIPWAEVRNRHLHGQKFRPIMSWALRRKKFSENVISVNNFWHIWNTLLRGGVAENV